MMRITKLSPPLSPSCFLRKSMMDENLYAAVIFTTGCFSMGALPIALNLITTRIVSNPAN